MLATGIILSAFTLLIAGITASFAIIDDRPLLAIAAIALWAVSMTQSSPQPNAPSHATPSQPPNMSWLIPTRATNPRMGRRRRAHSGTTSRVLAL